METSTTRATLIGAAGALLAGAVGYIVKGCSSSLSEMERETMATQLAREPGFASAVAIQLPMTFDDTRAKALAVRLAPLAAFRDPLIKAVGNDVNLQRALQVPVGTLLSSMLTPRKFEETYGKGWRLADGSRVAGTTYARATGNERLPDLRGMFLRGMNAGRTDKFNDPDNREVGGPQSESLGQHKHKVDDHRPVTEASQVDGSGHRVNDGEVNKPVKTSSCDGCGSETRPNNVAVYFLPSSGLARGRYPFCLPAREGPRP